MSSEGAGGPPAVHCGDELLSDIFHGLSQPLTAMECGLEIALRQDKTVAQLRSRMEALLGAARVLHQRLLEVRALRDAGDAGNTADAVAVDELLAQLRDDFRPIASEAKIALSVRVTRALAHGNATRLRNGFFHLLEFLVRRCPSGGKVRVTTARAGGSGVEVRFRIALPEESVSTKPEPVAPGPDFALRIASLTFQAAGGDLKLRADRGGQVAGRVRLRSATVVAVDA